MGMGNKKETSISKTKKIKVNKKNCTEKELRISERLTKPHSKEEVFSPSFEKKKEIK